MSRISQPLIQTPFAHLDKTGEWILCGRLINDHATCRGRFGSIELAIGGYPAYIEIPDSYATHRAIDGMAVWEPSRHAAHDIDGRPRRTPRNKPWTPKERQGMNIGERGRGRGQNLDDPTAMVADPVRRTRYIAATDLPILMPCPDCADGQLNVIDWEVLMVDLSKIAS